MSHFIKPELGNSKRSMPVNSIKNLIRKLNRQARELIRG